MCGISGIINFEEQFDVNKYYQAHTTMSHRGPNDEGFVSYIGGQFQSFIGNNTDKRLKDKFSHLLANPKLEMVLGHHRLSILDLSENGHQPFCIGQYAMVYNGEVYNYLELRDELIKLGHSFQTDCDTEVVLKAFIEWGVSCFKRFNGMWAIAIYDKENKTLLVSRDRFGVKPLYYEQIKSSVLFASEISFFKTMNTYSVNKKSTMMYLVGNRQDNGQETFYNNIQQVLPAYYYIFKNGKIITKERYWDFPQEKIKLSAEDALESFSEIFKSSIDLRLRSNVPIGCLLSGGLDSTLIVSVVSSETKNQEVNTYSAVYENQQFSEEKYIDKTLAMYPSLKGHLVNITSQEFLKDMDSFFKFQSGPVRSLAVYAQYKLYEYIARENKVTVLLNGQGSDECWGGYHNHYIHFFISNLLKGNISTLRHEIELYSKNRNVPARTIYQNVLKTCMAQMVPQSLKEKIKSRSLSRMEQSQRESALTLDGKLKENINYSALKEYLSYEDRNSMAFGKESRLPFLDYRLVELAFSLDDHFKINNFENKKLVRDFARAYIPKEVLERKDKMGFVTPQEVWQRNDLKNMMSSYINKEDKLFPEETSHVRQMAQDYFENKNNDWSLAWRYFNYQYWSSKEN